MQRKTWPFMRSLYVVNAKGQKFILHFYATNKRRLENKVRRWVKNHVR
jgi:hypothetical protein